jgi:hypothetical protein
VAEHLDPPAPCGHPLDAECGTCGSCQGCQPHEHRIEWAVRDRSGIFRCSESAAQYVAATTPAELEPVIVSRLITAGPWREIGEG